MTDAEGVGGRNSIAGMVKMARSQQREWLGSMDGTS